MNAGDSAGGGHQGRSPAPPAVPDRRSTSLTANNQAIPTLVTIATTHATNSNTSITPKRTDSISSYSEIPTSSRSFQQVFTQQQQLQLHSQEEAIVPFLSGSAVVTSQANNHSQHHMQPVSGHNVAGVAALTTVSNRHPTHDRIFVSQIKVPKISYSATSSQPTADVSSQVKRIKIDNVATDNVVIGAVGNLVGSLLPTVPSSGNRNSFRAAAETTPKDTITLKYLIIEKEYLRLKSIKEKHSDHVAELFYLESGSNMMDYPAWKKKPPSTQLIDFCNAYRLDQLENEEAAELTAEAATAKLQQEEAENIATVIGVHSSQPVKQQQTETSTTNAPKSTLPSTGQVALKRKRSLSLTPNVISAATTVTPSTSTLLGQESSLPQGAEIKIPAVGATPVAVSTQLPAAVVQLTQKGGTPLVPHCNANPSPALRRNGNGIDKEVPNLSTIAKESSANSPKSLYSSYLAGGIYPTGIAANESNTTTDVGHVAVGSSNSVQEFSFKAKQEVYVMQRISELQREGLWTEKRLPKQQEPSRTKAHWDYLLEEMVWLAADFAQERKWKKNAAKKCAKMVQKYFQDKANAAQKAEKAHELHLKRVASFISKEIKMFWSNVEKLVEYKHHTKIEEKRKKALDQHLSFIVDQTEKFSQQLAEGMNKSNMDSTIAASAAPSINSSRISSPKREEANISDDEFRPVSSSEDDEETIAKAEEEAANVNEEIVALEKEAKMDLDDFINDLPVGYLKNRDKLVIEDRIFTSASDDTDDAEFEADDVSEDDEKTISQQEAEETELDHKKELDELEADNDLTVEQLMKKYKSKQINNSLNRQRSKMEVDSDDDDDDDDDDTESDAESEVASDNSPIVSDNEMSSSSDAEEDDNKDGLKSLLEYNDTNQDDMIKDAAALAESIQPKGNTLSSTNVVTPVPFLLKHSLREYQHIGLDWLVTMNERKLNGILADEMGLGKTIQTIALLAHLACVKGNWGPHLIVVPSSVMLNWEMEFKKWCPGFKILTYYGTQKERKSKRVGWTKPNAFHVCITSYKLVVQDQQSFRRKKWKYLILDEAQNIKNFKSQRWQLLLNFSTDRRLLLTGTPLQNDLMELWSLMHFLMPYVFSSHREFKEWFSNPMTGMIEGNMEYNESLINRLHKVIRPFLLRRLKKEVEKQMPKKYEHVIMCRLSNRQRYLYDDFMSRAKTKETLQTGNLLSVINILMQLRKVCNHPNMFEVRPTISPFQMDGISYQAPRLVCDMLEYNPFKHIDLQSLNFILCKLEYTLTAYASYKSRLLAPRPKLIEEIDLIPEPPPRCPAGEYRFHVRVRDAQVQRDLSTHSSGQVQAGSSPAMKTENDKLVPIHNVGKASNRIKSLVDRTINPINFSKLHTSTERLSTKPTQSSQAVILGAKAPEATNTIAMLTAASTTTPTPSPTTAKIAKIVQSGKPYLLVTSSRSASGDAAGRLTLVCKPTSSSSQSVAKIAPSSVNSNKNAMVKALAQKVKTTTEETGMKAFAAGEKKVKAEDDNSSELDPLYNMPQLLQKRQKWRSANMKFISKINNRRTEAVPIYGADCREALEKCTAPIDLIQFSSWQTRGYTNCRTAMVRKDNWTLSALLKSYERRCEELLPTFVNFIIYVPSTCVPRQRFYVQNLCSGRVQQQCHIEATITRELSSKLALLHPITSAMLTQFPDPRLIQYDCGKLQRLDLLLRELKSGQHRVLIFTQMTKMLDVLEAFLNYHGHIYLRLDGSTRVEQRQILMERFNGDKRIFCFILSTRSGGIGINLTGADTVIFYDSDWNPTMDAQAQDRCHRIGQTRDVHIYRLVSEKTIEVNILKKANQKRMLSDMAIEGGNFTATFFKSSTIKDLFNTDNQDRYIDTVSCSKTMEVESEKQSLRVFETALAVAEDEQDVQATKTAKAEVAADLAEFDENIPIEDATVDHANNPAATAEMSKADLEVHNLVKQLSPIERYAMRFVEETGASWTAEQLRAAEEELEAQKREWEANRLAALLKEEEMLNKEDTAEDMITYSRKDATNQVNTNHEIINRSKKSIQSKKSVCKKEIDKKQHISSTMSGKFKSTSRLSSRQKLRSNKVSLSNKVDASSSTMGGAANKGGGNDNKSVVNQDLSVPTKPVRKITRTSTAAASGAINTSDSSPKKHTNEPIHDPLEVPVQRRTGVKNQKLLSISKKRKQLLKVQDNKFPSNKRSKLVSKSISNDEAKSPLRRCGNARFLRNTPAAKETTNRAVLQQEVEEENSNSNIDSSSASDSEKRESEASDRESDDNEAESETGKSRKAVGKKIQPNDRKIVFEDSVKYETENNCTLDEQTTTNSNSMDRWDAHAQIQDTATTNSTYYNVSEESESDDQHESSGQMNLVLEKSVAPVAAAAPGRYQRSSLTGSSVMSTPQQNQIDVNSPRTRSRGSVKINLWTLDVSPVLPGIKPQLQKTYKRDTSTMQTDAADDAKKSSTNDVFRNPIALDESTKCDSKTEFASTPVKLPSMKLKAMIKTRRQRRRFKQSPSRTSVASSSSTPSKSNNSNASTLHRWLLKTPKVALQRHVDAESSASEQSGFESPTRDSFGMENGSTS